MKALILAGGRGSRMAGASEDMNKCMFEVKGKPLIEYSLACAAASRQIGSIVILVGYKSEDIISRYADSFSGKPIEYVNQSDQQGLVNAIECAKEAIGGDDFMLMLGDEFMINPHHNEFIQAFVDDDVFALCGVLSVEDRQLIKKTYTVIQSEEQRIFRLIEKPNRPFTDIMGTGNCIFKNRIFDYIPEVPINQKRREKELPDLIQCAIDEGHIVRSFIICRHYINVNSQEELDKTRSYFAHL
ncbi:nucleotidyltransferase family protein [Candidatus Omnitrophota bacterium]